jgi:hypothetical protein
MPLPVDVQVNYRFVVQRALYHGYDLEDMFSYSFFFAQHRNLAYTSSALLAFPFVSTRAFELAAFLLQSPWLLHAIIGFVSCLPSSFVGTIVCSAEQH